MKLIRMTIDNHSQFDLYRLEPMDRGPPGPRRPTTGLEAAMYICVCNALRERDVRSAAEEAGITSAAGFFERKRIRPVCGKCVPDLHRLVREHRSAVRPQTPPG